MQILTLNKKKQSFSHNFQDVAQFYQQNQILIKNIYTKVILKNFKTKIKYFDLKLV